MWNVFKAGYLYDRFKCSDISYLSIPNRRRPIGRVRRIYGVISSLDELTQTIDVSGDVSMESENEV